MVNKILKIFFILFSILLLTYLAWPAPIFPNTLWDFETSNSPADKETSLRRGYYTNLTREQIMNHYASEFKWGLKLNYPPEEAQTIIRDQTQATFLEEIVHPMRESLFVAGNKVKSGKALFEINDKTYNQKIFVKYVDSNIIVRLSIGILTLGLIWIVTSEYIKLCKNI